MYLLVTPTSSSSISSIFLASVRFEIFDVVSHVVLETWIETSSSIQRTSFIAHIETHRETLGVVP